MQTLMLQVSAAEDVREALQRMLSILSRAVGCRYAEAWTPREQCEGERSSTGWTRAAGCPERGSSLMPFRTSSVFPLRFGAEREWGASNGEVTWADVPTDLATQELRAAVRGAGIRAIASVPVLVGAQPVAVLLMYFAEQTDAKPDQLEMVRDVVGPLGPMVHHKRIEAELARNEMKLADLVRTQTEELEHTHAQLRMADRLASIGTLAAGLGHDMNNVLLPVRARLGALKAAANRGEVSARASGHVEEIRKSIAYLQQLADGLHFLAMNPEAEKDEPEATDLRDWWSKVGPLVSRAVPGHVRVSASIPPGTPAVAVASHRLTQAVLNLVVNAGEAIPARVGSRRVYGRVVVSASTTPGDPMVRLGVTDNGRGMSEDLKRRALEMFFTTKRRGLGTGLGLPLVQKVAASAGGTVEIESKVGRGTSVVMLLRGAVAPSGGPRSVAAVSVPDTRAAAIIAQILEAGGFTLLPDGDVAGAGIWVIDTHTITPVQARKWQRRHPDSRLVVLGRPDGRAEAEWRKLDPVIIDSRDDLSAVRAALTAAMSPR